MDWTITIEALQRSRREVTRKRLAGLHPICKHLRLDMPLDGGATCGGQNRSDQPADEDGKERRSNWPPVPASAVALIHALVVVIAVIAVIAVMVVMVVVVSFAVS